MELMENNMPSKPSKFCIISRQRSGSTLLVDMLNTHPEITCLRELFISERAVTEPLYRDVYRYFQDREKIKQPRPFSVFSYFHDLHNKLRDEKIIGFKLMYNQIYRYPEILLALSLFRYKIIHLIRYNHLDIILSGENKDRYGVGHSKQHVKSNAMHIDPQWLIRQLQKKQKQFWTAQPALKLLPIPLEVVKYEDLCSGYQGDQALSHGLLSYLGTNEQDTILSSDYKKITKESHREKIANFSEIEEALQNTKFFHLLKY